MEVIQWTALWNSYKDEFENEKNMLGGSLGDKAAEDLKQRIIEHVRFLADTSQSFLLPVWRTFDLIYYFLFSEYSCCLKVLLEDYAKENCRALVSQYPGSLVII